MTTASTNLGLTLFNSTTDATTQTFLQYRTAVAGTGATSNFQKIDALFGVIKVDTTNSRLGIGTTSPAYTLSVSTAGETSAQINGATSSRKQVIFSTALSTRWIIRSDSDAESGANAGSKLSIAAFDDAGTVIGQAIGITRATLTVSFGGDLGIADGKNITFATTTGTKFGTSTSQKLGFWNATPIIQPTTGVTASTFVANAGTAINDASTFDGYTVGKVVKALRNTGILA